MALVKTIGGSVVNTAGVPLPSKTATLKNDDTGATITTTTTNADGEWEFANRDETIRYRVEAAFGGSSSQVVVRKPASAEFDHLYANLSFRSAAAAVVALGGNLTVSGNVGVGVAAGARALQIESATSDDHVYISSVGPSVVLANHATIGSGTKHGLLALSTAAGQYGVNDGDVTLAAYGNSRGDIRINANYSGTGVKHLYLQPTAGQVYFPDGGIGAPALAFGTDPNTGIFRSGEGGITLVANGVERLTTNPGGVGIPSALTVSGTTAIGGLLTVSGAATIGDTLTVTGQIDANNGIHAPSIQAGGGALQVTSGDVLMIANVDITGTLDLTGTLGVTGATTLTTATLSGVLTLPTGGVGNPSQRFAGDPDTGPYLSAADNYRIQAGGTDCATFAKIGGFAYFSIPGRFALTPDGSSAATPATVSGRYPLYNAGGAIIGYIPIYASL